MPLSISSFSIGTRSPILAASAQALVLFVFYNIFIGLVRPSVENVADNGTENRVIAERYIYAPPTAAVFVGSSLGRVLGQWLPDNIFDLAFSGGSPITGAEVVLRRERLPKIVVVETNVLERSLDASLVSDIFSAPMYEVRHYLPGLRREFRPANILTTYVSEAEQVLRRFLKWAVKDLLGIGRANQTFQALRVNSAELASAAADSGETHEQDDPRLAAGLKMQISYNATVLEAARKRVSTAVSQLVARIEQLRTDGVCVLMVRLPIHPLVDKSPLERYMDDAVHDALPRGKYDWIEIDRPQRFHTVDSLHLNGRSASIVAEAIAADVERRLHSNSGIPCQKK